MQKVILKEWFSLETAIAKTNIFFIERILDVELLKNVISVKDQSAQLVVYNIPLNIMPLTP